jgi:hypothetical protein
MPTMTEPMTLEQARDRCIVAIGAVAADGSMAGSAATVIRKIFDVDLAHVAPPAQTVDVGAIREVIDILQADGAPFGVKPLADRLTRALTGEKAGRVDGWLPIDTAPKGKPVLVHYINGCGKGRTIKARYVDRFTEESSPDSECDEYNEENDTYYTLPGWYEMIDNWDEYSSVFVHHDPILWHPLPTSPAPDKEG